MFLSENFVETLRNLGSEKFDCLCCAKAVSILKDFRKRTYVKKINDVT